MESNIFLAIFPPNGPEVHIKWTDHNCVETANEEILALRRQMILAGKIPMDCEVYEAEHPPFGLPSHLIDEVDMNFYTEKETRKQSMDFERTMQYLQRKAAEEEKKHGKV